MGMDAQPPRPHSLSGAGATEMSKFYTPRRIGQNASGCEIIR
jgi:hypothetical protein